MQYPYRRDSSRRRRLMDNASLSPPPSRQCSPPDERQVMRQLWAAKSLRSIQFNAESNVASQTQDGHSDAIVIPCNDAIPPLIQPSKAGLVPSSGQFHLAEPLLQGPHSPLRFKPFIAMMIVSQKPLISPFSQKERKALNSMMILSTPLLTQV
jgi:hypothetical protein